MTRPWQRGTFWIIAYLATLQLLSSNAFTTRSLTRRPSFRLESKVDKEENQQQKSTLLEPPISTFDPFQLEKNGSTADGMASGATVHEVVDQQKQADAQELGIWAARALLLLVAAIWGTNFATVKYLENLCFHPPCSHPPSEAAFARFGIAAIVSMPLLFRQRLDVIAAGLECGMWITLGYVSQAVALSTISSAKCAFICSLTVVFVPVVSAVLYGKPIKPLNFVAAMTALSGVAVLEGMIDFKSLLGIQAAAAESISALAPAAESASTSIASSGPIAQMAASIGVGKGDLLALGQPIGFGYCFTRIEHYQEQFKDVPNRVLTIAAAQCVSVGFLCLLWVLYDYHWVLPNFGYMVEPHRIAAIGWTGIVTTVCAIFLEGIALQTATATDAALAFSSEPVWASIFGFFLLHETLGLNAYIGGVIIMMACLIGAFSDLMAESVEEDSVLLSPDGTGQGED